MSDKIKAVFLGATAPGRAQLATELAARTEAARHDVTGARLSAGRLPDEHVDKAKLLQDAILMEASIATAQPPAQSIGDAFRQLGRLGPQAKALRQRAEDAAASGGGDGPQGRCNLIEMNIAGAKRAALLVANEAKAKEVVEPLAQHEQDYAPLQKLKDAKTATPQQMGELNALLQRVTATRVATEQAVGTPAEAGSKREKSRQRLSEMGAIRGLDGILDPSRRDPRMRRNAAEESAARLNVFDSHFAQPETDATARRTNQAMRTAAVIKSAAAQQAATENDPTLAGKLGSLMVREYGPDLGQSSKGQKLTQALVIDDPVEKLLTGKVRLEDAVMRVRDQAAMAGVKPSKMLDLLVQQVEMKLGGMDRKTDIEAGELQKDAKQSFVLSDLEGELGRDQATAIMGAEGPKLQSAGLKFSDAAAGQLQALRSEVKAWDKKERQKKTTPEAPWVNDEAERPDKPLVTPKMLQDQAAKLTNPADRAEIKGYQYDTDTNKRAADSKGKLLTETKPMAALPYVPAPGLGQDHKVTGPLDNSASPDPLHGALDDRQYAHLRMLQRADEEDKSREISYKITTVAGDKTIRGTPEQIVYEYFERVYKMEAGKTDALLKRVAEAFRSVPLTVTFTAASLFSAAKDAPAHGTSYVSDVEYTRGREDAASLIGRNDNIKVASPKLAALAAVLETKRKALATFNRTYDQNLKAADATGDDDAIEKLDEEKEALEGEVEEAMQQVAKLAKDPQRVSVTGGDQGSWMESRGENYQRWRRDKDRREGRLDEAMNMQQAQIFGAVNPGFAGAQGTGASYVRGAQKQGDANAPADNTLGENYYGDAHFKLKDSVRARAAFCVRGNSMSVGGGKSSVQRTDLMLMLADMIRGGGTNIGYIDSIAALASGGAKSIATGTDWEIHIYGGFDPTKDADEIYLSPKVVDPYRTRIANFAANNGLAVVNIQPLGANVIVEGTLVRKEIADAAGVMATQDAANELGAIDLT